MEDAIPKDVPFSLAAYDFIMTQCNSAKLTKYDDTQRNAVAQTGH